MIHRLSPGNSIGYSRLAKQYGLEELTKKARVVLMTHFKDIVLESDDFTNLSKSDLIDYISDDTIDVPNENVVFQAVMKWVKADEQERSSSFASIAEYVRFPFCTPAFLCYGVAEEPLMANPSCQKFLQEATAYHMVPDDRPKLANLRAKPRGSFNCMRKLYILGGTLQNDECYAHASFMEYKMSGWSHLMDVQESFLVDLRFSSMCGTSRGILVTGGRKGMSVKRNCFWFDLGSGTWKEIGPMQNARHMHHSVVHDAAAFVFGGQTAFWCEPLSSVEKFDLCSQTWAEVPPMPKPLTHPLAVTCRRKIFVLSGLGKDLVDSVCTQEFDPDWNTWSFRAPMPKPCHQGEAVCIDNTIYVVGGFTCACMRFYPLTNSWEVLKVP